MKTKIFSLLSSILLIAGLASCDNHNYGPEIQARGQLSFAGLKVEVDDSEVLVESRADDALNLADFIVTVTDNQGAIVFQDRFGSLPEVLDLLVGSYTVSVESHEVQPAEFNKPYYKGSLNIAIEKDKIKDVGTVECDFSSICVSIDYSDAIWPLLGDDFEVRVRLNDNAELTFKPDLTNRKNTRDLKGYFKAVSDTYSHTLIVNPVGTIYGNSINELRRAFEGVKAGEHHIVKFKLKNPVEPPKQTGNLDPALDIEIDHEVFDHNVEYDPISSEEPNLGSEDRPGQENPNQPEVPDDPVPPTDSDVNMTTPDPTGGVDKLQFGVPTPTTTSASGVVNITAESGLAHLYLEITSTNEEFAGIAVSMFGTGRYDMAYPTPGSEANLDELNLSYGSAILNQKEVPFDITSFIPLLSGFKGTHTFKLTVVSNKPSELSKSLIFVAE